MPSERQINFRVAAWWHKPTAGVEWSVSMDPTTIGTWVGVLVAVGGIIGGSVKFFFWVIDERQKRKMHPGFSVPRRTLQIATKMEGNCWWSMGKRGDEPTMQVVGSVFISNVAPVPVRIPQIELRYGFLGRKRVNGMVMVPRSKEDNLHGFYDIPPNETRNAPFDFWVYPPVVKAGEPFKAHSVIFSDQFGNKHRVKGVIFTVLPTGGPARPGQPEEFPYEMADPIEKEVVSVLKAEIGRFGQCGRRVGGLGSVHISYQGRTFTGVGGDSWTPDSPMNQLIAADPEAAELRSDNLDALLGFYRGLTTDDERARFVAALLDRLDGKRGYLDVSYFIVCVLFKVDHFGEALQKAKRDLPLADNKLWGLSNVLMMINGLLRYRHPDFTGEMLDDIERMTHGLDEHPFLIPAKLAAIRASRLPKS